MEKQRSITAQLSRTQKSKSSSLIRQGASSASINPARAEDRQKDTSATYFVRSCPFRMENVDRHAIIRRQDTESCLKRLSTRDDVYGVMVATMDGRILYECDALKNWISALTSFCSFARHVIRNIDPNDTIQALRLRTKNYEIIITILNEQLLIVMQMLFSNKNTNMNTGNNATEEDWEAFLKRIQQQKIENDS